ncbi:hypothetical protein AJ80_04109 [Polytolypa hystricis UAMH7299]|uniref:Uncharacterized protein n=1 Tax=Polytolypa hystricis (strain UAMH7299) TaxID=1447883 RepID=A0A2B7Y525_POLH7|nr:hypothetical protein AJ80_04109 [Polytolypa hystricis UAMH7299]
MSSQRRDTRYGKDESFFTSPSRASNSDKDDDVSVSSSSSSSSSKASPPSSPCSPYKVPPQPPIPNHSWLWRCHKCGNRYRLAVTNRCLEDGHYFCARPSNSNNNNNNNNNKPLQQNKKKRPRRSCTSQFDYTGWEDVGRWQRKVRRILGKGEGSGGCYDECWFPNHCRVRQKREKSKLSASFLGDDGRKASSTTHVVKSPLKRKFNDTVSPPPPSSQTPSPPPSPKRPRLSPQQPPLYNDTMNLDIPSIANKQKPSTTRINTIPSSTTPTTPTKRRLTSSPPSPEPSPKRRRRCFSTQQQPGYDDGDDDGSKMDIDTAPAPAAIAVSVDENVNVNRKRVVTSLSRRRVRVRR